MGEITVRALDSAMAMEEIVRRLGEDALIVSTRKVDQMIEIVATDEIQQETALPSSPSIVVETSAEKSVSAPEFQKILDAKLQQKNSDQEDESNPQQHYDDLITDLKLKIEQLPSLIEKSINSRYQKSQHLWHFRAAGLTPNLVALIPEVTKQETESSIAQLIAKKFVKGRSDSFEVAQVYFVIGTKSSGKSTFIEKFKSLIQSQNRDLSVYSFKNVTGSSDYNNISSWLRKKTDLNNKLIVEVNNIEQFDSQIVRFRQANTSTQFSVINVIEVGSSYEFLMKRQRPAQLDCEYAVVSKLDLCDISLHEICALIELGHRCYFFSGGTSEHDGLYFSKVGDVAAHLIALADRQKG